MCFGFIRTLHKTDNNLNREDLFLIRMECLHPFSNQPYFPLSDEVSNAELIPEREHSLAPREVFLSILKSLLHRQINETR